ncbi:hypothetical protein B2J93_459 [Marssonina coronariae]|uniref:WSC domain-containing protein n=1 Tax=Diplocarpon coronariae TaxID=2795749 RepID=A0A218ZDG9_9HELO|nr:hypothetical protein B2J93_459 [Marssonina coronariae]
MSPAFVLTLLLALWARHVAALASTDTITWGGDNSRTGYQTNHNMDPSIVGSSQFGQLFKTSLPGSYGGVPEQLFSQPLVYTPSDGVQYVYVATTQNNVYKINAKTGAIVLARSLHIPFLTADLDGCVDINPHVGVTATGVIDAATHTLYLTAKTYADQAKVNVAQGKPAGRYYLHALSADDLSERAGFPVSLEGTVARNNAVRSFNGGIHHQRPALLHAGPYIYAGFASHCVQYNFTGWIMGWDKATGATVERYATEGLGVDAQTKGAGVWMSGGGIASDDAGSMFFATGNGYASQLSTIPVNGRNPPTSLEEAAVHMTINADGSLSLVDFFMPWEKTQLDGADKDLGTSPLELLPSQFACGDVKRIGVVTGKSGKTYWLNLDDLGGYQNGPNKLDKIIQVYQNENSVYAGAGVYPLEGGYIYINETYGEAPRDATSEGCLEGPSGKTDDDSFRGAVPRDAFKRVFEGLPRWERTVQQTSRKASSGRTVRRSSIHPDSAKDAQGETLPTGDLRAFFERRSNRRFGQRLRGNLDGYSADLQDRSPDSARDNSQIQPANSPLLVINYPTHVFKFSCSAGVPSFAKVADSPTSNAAILGVGHGTTTSLNGQAGTGLVWTSDVRGDNLRIYNAVPQNGLLTMINSFNVDGITKFTRPVFGDGRVYLGTTKGTLYGFGSPVNLPINCTSPVQFGSASLNNATAAQTVTCRAVVGVTIANISLSGDANFAVSGLAAVPATLAAGATFRFDAVFNPKSVGVLSADVVVATTNGVAGYSTRTPITLRGTGQSASPLLQISPVTLAFEGVIAGGQPGGVDQSLIFTNLGSAPLTISGVEWSTAAETGPFVAANGTAAQPRVGPFTFTGLPTTIPANAGVTVSVNFDSSVSGNYGAYARVTSDGGTRLFDVVATAGSAPAALVEFQTPDGAGWVAFDAGQNFTFGNVTENTTRSLRMRVTNNGPADGSRLSLTVSKPPFGVAGLIGANNQVDLAEGTTLGVGENATATLYCSVPKRQWNTDPYSGAAHWTLNLNDPNFGKHDIGFLCQAVAEQAAPLQPSGLGVYRYAGCYKENNPGRQLKTQLGASSTMTSAVCIAACAAAGVTYCGTQYNRECWGGPTIPTLQVADGNCDYPCTGDVNQICGGNGVGDGAGGSYISLFAKSGSATTPGVAPGGPYTNPGVGGYASIGCYTESTTGRALPNGKAVTTKTVASCVAACAASNNIYAGLEYGGEVGDNATEYCGAGNRLNVYQRSASSASSSRPVTLSSSAVASGISSAAATSSGLAPPASGGLTSTSAATDIPSSLSLSGASTVTSAPSSAPPAPTGPAIRPVVSGYSFLGCYTESTTGRALSLSSYASDTMTLESCAAYCSAYSMFGVEYGRECYCGNSLGAGSIKATNQADCSFLCPGDRATYCGAGVRLQLYGLAATGPSLSGASSTGSPASSSSVASSAAGSSTGSLVSSPTGSSVGASTGLFVSSATDAPAGSSIGPAALSSTGSSIGSSTGSSAPISSPKSPATSATSTISTLPPASPTSLSTPPTTTSARKPSGPTIVPSIGLYHYLGCYTEGTNVRALAGALYANDSLTMQTCAQACGEYTYFGAEYGRECWCGNSFGAGSVLAPKGDAECTKLCAGDGSQYCGNGNRLSVYIKNGTVGGGSSIPSAGPSAATVSSTVSSLSTAASTSSIAPSSTSGVASSPASSATSSSASSATSSSASSVAPSSASSATSSSASSATSSSASSVAPSSASSATSSSASSATSSSTSSATSSSASSATSSSASSATSSSASSATSSSTSSATSSSASSATSSSASSATSSSASSATSSSTSSVASPSTSSVTASATSSTASSSTTSSSPTATSLAQSSSSAKTSTSTTSTTSSSKAAAYTGPPITSPGNANYTYYSCISEPSAGRLLPSQVDNNATSMSIERCLGRCGPRGYKYVGVEYGVECWCGNTLNLAGNAGATPARNVSDSQCSFKCPGNATEFCGAGSRLNLYYYDFAKAAANAV